MTKKQFALQRNDKKYLNDFIIKFLKDINKTSKKKIMEDKND
ncbi:hypothetical protein [[Mycoplasma] testudinis]|nr:hypothetical protein [[Mycoplasma] testudinis]